MKKFQVTVHIFVNPVTLNPEEGPTREGLIRLGFTTVSKITMGKCFILTLEAADEADAKQKVTEMCNTLLINRVTEHFKFEKVEEVQ